MIGQSFAIIAVILIMSFMFLRAGRRAGALFALPLISVSAFHLIGYVMQSLSFKNDIPINWLHIAFDVIGLIVGLWFCYKLSRAIHVKKLRNVYFASCAIFLSALVVAYMGFHI